MVVREGSVMEMFRAWASSVGSTLSSLSIIPKYRLYVNITVYNQNQNYLWTVFDTYIYTAMS